jgi:single-strand DNA-binding protein
MNNLQINGRLTADPELKYTPAGKAILRLSLAHNYWHGADKEATPIYFEATFWEISAESVNKKGLKKGTEIMVSGQFLPETYEHNGTQKTKYTLQYPQFICIVQSYQKPADNENNSQEQENPPTVDNDDVPF